MPEQEDPLVIPVVREEVHADARPVHTGSVRVTKTLSMHEELLEQELRKGRADVERVPMQEVVDGPLPPRREGRTLIIPVVSEQLQDSGKRWILTEEIRVTQLEESETVQQRVPVREESARVERLDAEGHVIATETEPSPGPQKDVALAAAAAKIPEKSGQLRSIVSRDRDKPPANDRVLSTSKSILRKKRPD